MWIARSVCPKVWSDVGFFLGILWGHEHIAGKGEVSHGCVYLHVYPDKATGGDLHTILHSLKTRYKSHLRARESRAQIFNSRHISDRSSHIKDRKQVGHWEGHAVIGAARKQPIVTLVQRKAALLSWPSYPAGSLIGWDGPLNKILSSCIHG
jgi:IS30 family transposase